MLVLFTDGACSGNPGPGGWACVAALPGGRARELAGRAHLTTNNRMEMSAVLEGLRLARSFSAEAVVHTDSTYVLGGVEGWLASWKRRGWRTAAGEPVKNEDLWRELDGLLLERGPGRTSWRWVKGHAGHEANERCDRLAVALSRGRPVELFDGPLLEYPHGSLAPAPAGTARPARPAGSSSRRAPAGGPPAAYLSLVDGRLARHDSWAECQARVLGRSGARFRKVRGPDEERAAREAWGA